MNKENKQMPINFPARIDSVTKVVVVGLGKSGLAAQRLFSQMGAQVSVSDNRNADVIGTEIIAELLDAGIYVETGGHSEELFTNADLIMVSPGVPHTIAPLTAARAAGVCVLGEMGLAAPMLKTPMVAVTGTNGKSTVTKLIGDICRAAGKKVFVGGNIGTPLAEYLAGPQDADVVVLEVSSFQLDTAPGFRPQVALLLNITPDHLDRYASYSAYGAAKFAIFAAQTACDTAILNRDDAEITGRLAEFNLAANCLSFGQLLDGKCGAARDGDHIILRLTENGVQESYNLGGGIFSCSPNFENGMAAIIAARLMGCAPEVINKSLAAFSALGHRMTLVTELDGVKYYDDSKATNIGAVKAALAGLDSRVILIVGGRDKGGDYAILKDIVASKVKYLLLIGEASSKIAAALTDVTEVEKVADLAAAVSRAQEIAKSGDTVLLSPACASFDMFTSYSQRGEVFSEAVLSLKKKAA